MALGFDGWAKTEVVIFTSYIQLPEGTCFLGEGGDIDESSIFKGWLKAWDFNPQLVEGHPTM